MVSVISMIVYFNSVDGSSGGAVVWVAVLTDKGVVSLWLVESYGSTGEVGRFGVCWPNSITQTSKYY